MAVKQRLYNLILYFVVFSKDLEKITRYKLLTLQAIAAIFSFCTKYLLIRRILDILSRCSHFKFSKTHRKRLIRRFWYSCKTAGGYRFSWCKTHCFFIDIAFSPRFIFISGIKPFKDERIPSDQENECLNQPQTPSIHSPHQKEKDRAPVS